MLITKIIFRSDIRKKSILEKLELGDFHGKFVEILGNPNIFSAMTMAISIYGTLCVLVSSGVLFLNIQLPCEL